MVDILYKTLIQLTCLVLIKLSIYTNYLQFVCSKLLSCCFHITSMQRVSLSNIFFKAHHLIPVRLMPVVSFLCIQWYLICSTDHKYKFIIRFWQQPVKTISSFSRNCNIVCWLSLVAFIYTLMYRGKFGPPDPGKATAAARAALPSPTSACWVFLCFRNPPDSDMDYRIFNVCMWSFLCVHVHTGVGHTDSESAQLFLLEKKMS